KFDLVRKQTPQHQFQIHHDQVQIHHDRSFRLFAVEGQELLGQRSCPICCRQYLLAMAAHLVVRGLFHRLCCVACNQHQEVIEIVGESARQLAERFHLLRLIQLCFEVSCARNVAKAPHTAGYLPVQPLRLGVPLEYSSVSEKQNVEAGRRRI